MWTEYIRSLYPKANIEFNSTERTPCVNMATKTISIPAGFPEGVMTRAVVKHELGHLLFTEKSYDEVAKEEKLKINDAGFDIANAIEDIRIEKRFGTDYLGVKLDFEELSKTVFSKIENIPNSLHGLGMLTSYYLNFGKLPDAKVDGKLLEFFNREKADLYTKFLGLKDVNGSVILAEELLDKYEKEFGKLPQREQNTKGKGKAEKGEGEKGEGKGEKGESAEGEKGEGEGTGEKGEGEGTEGEGKGEGKGKGKGEGSEGVEKTGEGQARGKGSYKEIAWGDDRIEKGTSSIHELVKEYISGKVSGHTFNPEKSKYSNCGENLFFEGEKLASKFSQYCSREIKGIEGQVLKIRQVLLSWLTDEARNRTLRLKKSGKISSRDLFRVKTEKQPKVFKKKILGKSNTVDLEILIDHSGSMRGYKIDTALEMAYIFNEALKSIKQVNYEITGFTTRGFEARGFALDNVYYIYKSFGTKANALTKKLLLKDIGNGYTSKTLCHNNDYEALGYAEKRLAKQSNNRKILFVISDGRPEVGYVYSSVMDTMTRDKIEDLRKKGYEVYGFGIHVDLTDLYKKNFVEIADTKKLANIVSTKLLKVIQK